MRGSPATARTAEDRRGSLQALHGGGHGCGWPGVEVAAQAELPVPWGAAQRPGGQVNIRQRCHGHARVPGSLGEHWGVLKELCSGGVECGWPGVEVAAP